MIKTPKFYLMLFFPIYLGTGPAFAGTYQLYYSTDTKSIYNTSATYGPVDATYYRDLEVSYETRFQGAGLGYLNATLKHYCNNSEYATNRVTVTTSWRGGSDSLASLMPSCSRQVVTFKWTGDGWWNFGGPNQIKNVSVTGIKDPPVATAQSVSVNKNSATGEITLGASDLQNAPLSLHITSAPSKGTLSWNGLKFIYTPNTCASGSDSFQYYVRETIQNQNSSTVTVSITINHVNYPPIHK